MENPNQQTPMKTVWFFVLGTMALTLCVVTIWHQLLLRTYLNDQRAGVSVAELEIAELLRYRAILQSGGKEAGELYVALRKGTQATTTP